MHMTPIHVYVHMQLIGRQPMTGGRTACMGSEVRHRYACMHLYSTATSIYTHLVMHVVIPFALIQVKEHNLSLIHI